VIETYFAKKEGRPLPALTPVPAPTPPEQDPDIIQVDAPAIAAVPPVVPVPGTN
jgi:hypothetical protein